MPLRFLGLRPACAALLWCAAFASPACAGGQTGEEDPVPQCLADADCPSGACVGARCVPLDDLCAATDDCADGFVCHYSEYHCPPESGEEDCPDGTRGLCTRVQTDCSADEECADDELCWAVARFDCAPSDPACDAAEPGICSDAGRFCEADDAPTCAAEESCIDRRCTYPGAQDEHDEIALDAAKNDAIEPIWRDRHAHDGGGCSAAPGRGTALTPLLLVAAFAALRAYLSALKPRSNRIASSRSAVSERDDAA
jgi:hypothetical protein